MLGKAKIGAEVSLTFRISNASWILELQRKTLIYRSVDTGHGLFLQSLAHMFYIMNRGLRNF